MSHREIEYEALLKRFRHLLESKTIREYDEVNPNTREYKKNPLELDRYIDDLKNTIVSLQIENSKLKTKIKIE